MKRKNKNKRIEIRVTEAEHRKIKEEAKRKNTTMTALILRRFESNVTINLDTSNYRDLLIEQRRIGNNINQVLRRINKNEYYTQNDLELIKRNQEILERELNNQGVRIRKIKTEIENLTPNEMIKILEREEKEIPNYLIYDEIVKDINKKLLDISELAKDEELNPILIDFIRIFTENFVPTYYSYDELLELSNKLSDEVYRIDQKILLGENKIDAKDLRSLRYILRDYRKDLAEEKIK